MAGATSKDGKFRYNGTDYNTFEEAEEAYLIGEGVITSVQYNYDGYG
jgi:hypothetical protein